MPKLRLRAWQSTPPSLPTSSSGWVGNPALAKRVVHEELLGIGDEMSTDHRQYIDGTPFLIASLSAISIVRFVGIGMGDKVLYMVGGIAMILAMTLRTLFYSINRKSTRLGR
jgi:hypothetical protein